MLLRFHLLLLVLLFASAGAFCRAEEVPAGARNMTTSLPGEILQAQEALSGQFHADKLWSGGDGAYSISLGGGRTLWLFGDSFIGTISDGRKNNAFIHNAVSIQDRGTGKMTFYWSGKEKPSAYFPDGKDYWIWPGDGVVLNDRVYCFARRIGLIPGKENDPFGFTWNQDELIVVENPSASPDEWRCRHLPIRVSSPSLHLGSACLKDSAWLYTLGLKEKTREAILARISLENLRKAEVDNFEFLHIDKDKSSWSPDPLTASPLFGQAATEGSLLKNKFGYSCIYTRASMGSEIVERRSLKIEGPWSEEKTIYIVPAAETRRGFCYAAKAHPEQTGPGFLAITYCCNPGDLSAHSKDPLAYFPHVIYLKYPQK